MAKQIVAHQYFISNLFIWLKVLFQNRGVSLKYIPKAIIISILSLISLPFQIVNYLMILNRVRKLPKMEDPIFIVGHWRGGTTYLHYLLAKDERLGYLTYYQAFAPNLSTVGGRFFKRFLARLMPSKRPQDNIEIHMDFPMEEENPIAAFSEYSASHSFFFPRNESYYQKYVLFEGLSNSEKKNWQLSYKSMIYQIATKFPGRRLLIKNPHNTGRIKELLEIYPKAKFIHIYRNPYEVFPSTYLMYDRVVKTQFLQKYSQAEIENKILYYYSSMMKRYFADKEDIPEDQLIEIQYEEFEKTPLEHVKEIYKRFNVSLPEHTFKKMFEYVESLKGYQKNKHKISQRIKKSVNINWGFAFEELGYPMMEEKKDQVKNLKEQ